MDEKIAVVETAGHFKGLAPFVTRFKKAGAYVIHKCVAVRHAKSAQRLGVDMISMDGFECAGHPGELDTGNWLLLAIAAKELDIPFVASGGCATGSQLAAALALGAEGLNMGTRFMATVEAPIHDNIKQALAKSSKVNRVWVTFYSSSAHLHALSSPMGQDAYVQTSRQPRIDRHSWSIGRLPLGPRGRRRALHLTGQGSGKVNRMRAIPLIPSAHHSI